MESSALRPGGTEEPAEPRPDPAEERPAPAEELFLDAPPGRTRRVFTAPATIALATWLVAIPAAMVVPELMNLNPFAERGAFAPVAIGAGLLAAGYAVSTWWRAGAWLSDVAAGLFAAWVALTLRFGLTGTPFGYAGLQSDNGRMTTSALRYTVHLWSTDTFVEGLPSEYPPLFPWVVGRLSLVLHIPVWRLVGPAEVVLMSFAVVAGYLMWRRLVSAPAALVCAASVLLVYGVPFKPFTVVALVVTMPWVIATFGRPPNGRLHWLPAGLVGGLLLLTYHGWFTFAAVGILAVIVSTYRHTERARGRFVGHVLLTGAVALVVASPYLVPFGHAILTQGGEAVSDLYLTDQITNSGFPFLEPTLLGLLQLVGLAGLVLLRQGTFWARPMLYVVLGAFAFWLGFGIRFLVDGHTTLFYYVDRLNGAVLAAAGVLTLVHVVPLLARKITVTPYKAGAAVVAVALLWVGYTYWQAWRPRTHPETSEAYYATVSHLEPLPDCSSTRYKPKKVRGPGCLPVDEIEAAVKRVRPDDASPHTLSAQERLFSYLPWRAYSGADRTSAGTLVRFDERHAELVRLTDITDPAEFADATRHTEFGPIDVFLLNRTKKGWTFGTATFRGSQFDPAEWKVIDRLDWPVVVVIRR